MSLFSIFDPSTIFYTSFNWFAMICGLMFLPFMFWLTPSRYMMFSSKMLLNILTELKTISAFSTPKGWSIMLIGLFLFIVYSNFLGLFPFIFTSTAHLLITLSLAFPLWLSFLVFGWSMKPITMLAHLIPQGTPKLLMVFMVIIETISNLIRPITLSVRLAANMIAGHLLLTLLSGQISTFNLVLFLIIFSQFFLLILESAVAIIQSYVFMVLSSLYSAETY